MVFGHADHEYDVYKALSGIITKIGHRYQDWQKSLLFGYKLRKWRISSTVIKLEGKIVYEISISDFVG